MKLPVAILCLLLTWSSYPQKTDKSGNSNTIDYYTKRYRNAKSIKLKMHYADTLVDKLYYTNTREALIYNDSMMHFALQLNDTAAMFDSKDNLAIIKTQQNDYLGALDIYFETLPYSKKINSPSFESATLYNISVVYLKMGDYEEVEKYNLRSLKIREKNQLNKRIYLNYQLLGSVFFLKGDLDESRKYFQKALSVAPENEYQHYIPLLNNLASIEYKTGNNEKAQEIYKSCLKYIHTKCPDFHSALCGVYYNIALTYNKQELYDQSIQYLDSSLVSATKIHSKKDIAKALELKSDLLHLLKKHDESWKLKETYIKYKDSITEDLQIEAVNKLKESQEIKEYKDSLQYVSQLNKEFEKNTTLTKGVNIFIIIVAGLFLFILILYINLYRLKSKKEKAEIEQTLLRTQMNPHFIFNALNSIQRMYVEGDTDKANDFMADFAQLIRKVLENSGSTMITLHEEIETLKLYFDLEQLRSKNGFSYTIQVDESLPIHDLKIPPLIIQPFVENAIWHGVIPMKDKQGLIIVTVSQEQANIRIQVSDNGIGIQENKMTNKHLSKGIQITESRIGQKVSISSETGKGTQISFTIKAEH